MHGLPGAIPALCEIVKRWPSQAARNSLVALKGLISALIAVVLTGNGAMAAGPLQLPFDVEARRMLHGAPAEPFACPSPPGPMRDLTFDGFYRRGSGSSVVDQSAMQAYRAARKPVDDFERGLARLAENYVGSRPAEPSIARCALDWLESWAAAGGYLGAVSQQGGYVRKWSLATVSFAWLAIRDVSGLDPRKTQRVRDWIARWGAAVMEDYSTGTDRSSRNNNHLYWAALAVGLAGVAGNDRTLFDWMVARYRQALGQIDSGGILPLERDRGSRALHYHVFSLSALVPIAELGVRNGLDLYSARDGALHRLVRRTLDGLDDPSFFEKQTGQKQGWVGKLDGGKLAWLEIYHARFPDAASRRWVMRFRPLKNRRTGGNATLLWGVSGQ